MSHWLSIGIMLRWKLAEVLTAAGCGLLTLTEAKERPVCVKDIGSCCFNGCLDSLEIR